MRNLSAQEFFDQHVTPAISDWQGNELAIYKAKMVATNLNQMADYYFNEFSNDANKVLGVSSPWQFRDALSQQYPDFALIRDIADSHKHVLLSRASRRISNESQTRADHVGWDEAGWDDARWGSPEEIVVVDDCGQKHHFIGIVERVSAMWRSLLE